MLSNIFCFQEQIVKYYPDTVFALQPLNGMRSKCVKMLLKTNSKPIQISLNIFPGRYLVEAMLNNGRHDESGGHT